MRELTDVHRYLGIPRYVLLACKECLYTQQMTFGESLDKLEGAEHETFCFHCQLYKPHHIWGHADYEYPIPIKINLVDDSDEIQNNSN